MSGPYQFEHLDPEVTPSAQDKRAANSVCTRSNVVYRGTWFQFSRRARSAWNELLTKSRIPEPLWLDCAGDVSKNGMRKHIQVIEPAKPDTPTPKASSTWAYQSPYNGGPNVA